MSIFKISLLPSGITLTAQQIRNKHWPDHLNEYERQAISFCESWLSGEESFVLHTSGSTGTPKPIAIQRQQMVSSARMTGRALGLKAGDQALVNLNVQYIAGIMMLVRGMELEMELTVIEPSSLPLAAFSPNTRFDFLSFVPLQLQAILAQQTDKLIVLQHAKAIILGGAPISSILEDQLQVVKAPVFQTYGMTETVSHIALRRLNGPERADYYTLLEGVKIETDSRDCLIIKAPTLAEQPVVTNDVVELLSPHTFRWIGRADNIINSGGVKVQAEKVEKVIAMALQELKAERRFFIGGLPHAQLGEVVTLFIEGSSLEVPIEDFLQRHLSDKLIRYEIPKAIYYCPVFPETPTGKIDRKAVIAFQQNQSQNGGLSVSVIRG